MIRGALGWHVFLFTAKIEAALRNRFSRHSSVTYYVSPGHLGPYRWSVKERWR